MPTTNAWPRLAAAALSKECETSPILRFDDAAPLRVRDVARLELGREDVGLIAGTNGRPGISLVAIKKANADIRVAAVVGGFGAVGAMISNDDWGFKTQTMLSLDQMRRTR